MSRKGSSSIIHIIASSIMFHPFRISHIFKFTLIIPRVNKKNIFIFSGYQCIVKIMDSTFLEERITKCQEQIVAYEDAIEALITKQAKSYTLNTGQTVQTVTRQDLGGLQRTLEWLMNRLTVMEARLNGGSTMVSPAW